MWGGGRSPEFLMRAVTAVGFWGIIFAMYFTTEEVWRRYSKPVSRRSGRWLVRPMLWTCDSLSFSKTDRGGRRSAHHFFAPPPFFPIWSLSAVWACFPGFKLIFNRYPRSGAFFHRWTSYTYPLAPRSGINSAGAWGVRRRERRLRSMGWISCLRCWFLQSRPVGPRIEKGRGGGGARRVLGFYMSITN